MSEQLQEGAESAPENEILPEEPTNDELAEEPEEPENNEPEPETLPEEDGEPPLPEDPDTEDEEEKKTWPKGVADRIKRQKLMANKAKQEAIDAKMELERFKSERQQPTYQNNAHYEDAPTREKFQSEAEYIDAVFDYKAQKINQEKEAMHFVQAESNFRNRLTTAMDDGSAKYGDYKEVIAPLFAQSFPTNRAMAEAIVDSDYKHDMFYFLGKYPDKAKEIALLNPIAAVKEITKLEIRFKERQRSKKSAAPAPLGTIKGSVGTAANKIPEKMSTNQEFTEWYNNKFK